MNKYSSLLLQLENDLRIFTKENPSLKHLLVDSFNDHHNRYKKDLEIITKYFKGGKILDVGASPFHITYCLKKSGYDVIGLDIEPTKFRKFINKYNLPVERCDIETQKFPFKDNSFDLVIFNEVFEHLRIDPIFTLKEINRVLKPGRILFLTTPNLYAIHKIFMFNLGKGFNDAYDEFNKLNIYGYMGHIREYSTQEVSKFLKNTNFKIEGIIYRHDYSFFNHPVFKNILIRLIGLGIDLLMVVNPSWRRHQAFIAKKI